MLQLFKLYQFGLGVGSFLLALFFGWGLPMIIPSTPDNGILITIAGLIFSTPFFIWAYVRYKRQQLHNPNIKQVVKELLSVGIYTDVPVNITRIFYHDRERLAVGLSDEVISNQDRLVLLQLNLRKIVRVDTHGQARGTL